MTHLKVAIIGAGPSGLAALRALRQEGGFTVHVYERRASCGGVWNHDKPARTKPGRIPATDPEHTDTPMRDGARLTWPSPMYDLLHTNIPAPLMAYGDMPFSAGTAFFPTRQKVLSYIQDFACKYELASDVQYNTQVVSITKEARGWAVKTLQDETVSTSVYDRIVVASGHYETPFVPDIPGLAAFNKQFPEAVSHSKYYRSPAAYAGQKTVLIGNGPSGLDIASQLAKAPDAHLPILRSVRTPSKTMPAGHVMDIAEIASFSSDRSILLKDGTQIASVDRVLFCTGYLYSFPFLSSALGIVTDGLRLHHLYQHVFYQHDPTLAMLGMEMAVVPFPYSEAQACFLACVWSGRLALPSLAVMQAAEEARVQEKGDGRAYMVRGHPEDGEYIESLREACLAAQPRNAQALMPVKWRGERWEMRAKGAVLRQAWLAEQEQVQTEAVTKQC